jgi:hypothetical protein
MTTSRLDQTIIPAHVPSTLAMWQHAVQSKHASSSRLNGGMFQAYAPVHAHPYAITLAKSAQQVV